MFFLSFDDDVIDINLHIFAYLIMQTFLHTTLISCAGISQTKAHYTIAISPVLGNKGSLYLIDRVQWYLVKTRVRIYKRQQGAPGCGVNHLIDPGQRERVF